MVYIVLALLFLKHLIFDFIWQTQSEVENKGKYGNLKGLKHSVKHMLGSVVILTIFTPLGFLFAFLDLVIHYHVDWVKKNYGEQDPTKPSFWRDLGLDQFAHYLTYLGLAWLAMKYKW